MLEGKEVEVALGKYGSASVDVTPDLKLVVAVQAQIDLLGELKKLAADTKTTLDDSFLATVEKLLAAKSALGK